MSLKCELSQRATKTKFTSIMVPIVPDLENIQANTHTHKETLHTHSHVHTHPTNGENRSDNVPWEHSWLPVNY